MKGLELARRFYAECVKPILVERAPQIVGGYAAGLIGFGSDVLGNDDEISRDHEWGPRCIVFLQRGQHGENAGRLHAALDRFLPPDYLGYPTRFRFGEDGSVPSLDGQGHHHVALTTPQRFLQLAIGSESPPQADREWLAIPEQRLLEITAGDLFDDFTGETTHLRDSLSYFPENVWRFRLAFALESLGWEDELIYLCGHRGDRISMQLNAAKTTERIMRLVFLLNKRYAPLSPKWLQREFRKLPEIAGEIHDDLGRLVEEREHHEKTDALNSIYEIVFRRLDDDGICSSYPAKRRQRYSGVHLDAQRSAKDVLRKVTGELSEISIKGLPFGAIDQWMCNEDISMSAGHMRALVPVYRAQELERNMLGDTLI